MANPNIVAVTSIYGNTSTLLISSTADPFATALVSNAASSGKVYKINSIALAVPPVTTIDWASPTYTAVVLSTMITEAPGGTEI